MVNMTISLDYLSLSDRRLVELHLAGDRTAFRQIVERYQAMVCALGLSACGDVGRSEDLAQEVFLAAWRELPGLREPDKLRGWLAGIARNLSHNSFRRQRRTPTAQAEPLSPETPSGGENPRERAIGADEAALMWQTLEAIPENYREPMVLFYREHRSVLAVAVTLEISEDAVRQRLARGRALLSERMAKLVEETLERSAPTPVFTGAVLLAVPLNLVPFTGVETTAAAVAKTAAVSGGVAAATKGGLAVKALAVVGALPMVINGAMDFLRFRTRYEASVSPAKRHQIVTAFLAPNLIAAGLLAAFLGQHALSQAGADLSLNLWILCSIGVLGVPIIALVWIGRWRRRTEQASRMENDNPVNFSAADARRFEYRSQRTVLGLPLLDVHLGGQKPVMRRTARGWIAVSDGIALGGLFAYGGRLAVAPVGIGPGAIGLVSLGIVTLGVGTVGALAGGFFSLGIISFGWNAAQAITYAAAGEFAQGFHAVARHANDAMAARFFHDQLFFRAAATTAELIGLSFWFAWMVPVTLTGYYLWRKRPER